MYQALIFSLHMPDDTLISFSVKGLEALSAEYPLDALAQAIEPAQNTLEERYGLHDFYSMSDEEGGDLLGWRFQCPETSEPEALAHAWHAVFKSLTTKVSDLYTLTGENPFALTDEELFERLQKAVM